MKIINEIFYMVNFSLEKNFFLCYNLYKKRLFVSLKQIGGENLI